LKGDLSNYPVKAIYPYENDPVSLVLPSGLESFCLFSSVYGYLKAQGGRLFYCGCDGWSGLIATAAQA
jgi:hypothetical protein